MKAKTKQTIRRYVYLVAAVLAGVAEAIRNSGDITSFTWAELLDKSLKALPFVILGYATKKNFDVDPNRLQDSEESGKKN